MRIQRPLASAHVSRTSMRARILGAWMLPLLALCMGGCGPQVDVTTLGNPRSPHEGRGVRVLFQGESLPKTYDRIALLHVVGEEYSTQDEVLNALKRKAWKMGADAVIEVERGSERADAGSGILSRGDERREYTAITFTGVAIVALDPDFALDHDLRFLGKGPAPASGRNEGNDRANAIAFLVILLVPILWVSYLIEHGKTD